MERVLVLGGTGFIGGHVIRRLLSEGFSVRAFKRPGSAFHNLPGLESEIDVREGTFLDPHTIHNAMQGCTNVIHSAMPYPILSVRWKKRWPAIRQGLRNVIEAASKTGVERFVFTSVCSTIGSPARPGSLAMEENAFNLAARSSIHMKHLAEEEIRQSVLAGFPGIVVNPCFTLGPYDSKPSSGQFLLNMLLSPVNFLSHFPVNVVDVRDVAAGHVAALEKGDLYTRPGDRYLLGNWNTTFGEVARLARRIAGLHHVWRPSLPTWILGGAARSSEWIACCLRRRKPAIPLLGIDLVRYGSQHVSVARALRELTMPQTPIEQTIEDSIRYFLGAGKLKLRTPESVALERP